MSSGTDHPSTAILAVDTGGTFTDLLLLESGVLTTLKVPSTPKDPADAVLAGSVQLLGDARGHRLLHGSTVATNGLLERNGARVILVTNRGFEDILEIGRQNRPQLYALVGRRPPPLVARGDRLGIGGRLGPDGQEIQPLDTEELKDLKTQVQGADSLAVVLLHSYANRDHEEAVAEALEELGLPLSVSSRLLPEYREYERTSTTVVNAYVSPLMSTYLGRLDRESGARPVHIMASNGGAVPVERAIREPVHTVLSGPAGGVVGALDWARRAGFDQIVTFDMGGTSTDVSLCPGRPLHTREFEIAGQPVAVPVIDIHTVGAGGGSLARVDAGGALRVGPESAGADPGPIAYGQGGTELTVTDAHVWLGRLPSEAFLGGEGALDRASIAGPLEGLAGMLEKTPEDAAEGILSVANTAMERALRVISVERGFDPADFVIVAFGGAGALHVAELADRLGVARALVPPDPGLLSAYGMLAAPPRREVSQTLLASSSDPHQGSRMEDACEALESQAIQEMVDEGNDPGALTVRHWVDARYRGQSFELRVPRRDWVEAFHQAHEERYGYSRPKAPVEAVTVRAVAEAPPLPLDPSPLPRAEGNPPLETSTAYCDGNEIEVRRVWRKDLQSGHTLEGPVIVLEYSSTTWLPPGWMLEVDTWGSLLLTKE
ncbi:MAG: hydantoinase/oxoprolinase family protein [Gemmatimonadetes bacterium]|nr:hydantoinase/oxoprolinase family protein [Gemmatimonadota bacterium]NNM07282.1 hydantoinase/oxoprolinase family protein [Gemmatimonadota bacterium]